MLLMCFGWRSWSQYLVQSYTLSALVATGNQSPLNSYCLFNCFTKHKPQFLIVSYKNRHYLGNHRKVMHRNHDRNQMCQLEGSRIYFIWSSHQITKPNDTEPQKFHTDNLSEELCIKWDHQLPNVIGGRNVICFPAGIKIAPMILYLKYLFLQLLALFS